MSDVPPSSEPAPGDLTRLLHRIDAGTTDTGRPYFVMELVRGVPITRYCDDANLPTAHRLALFNQVCHAIQHAPEQAQRGGGVPPQFLFLRAGGTPLIKRRDAASAMGKGGT